MGTLSPVLSRAIGRVLHPLTSAPMGAWALLLLTEEGYPIHTEEGATIRIEGDM